MRSDAYAVSRGLGRSPHLNGADVPRLIVLVRVYPGWRAQWANRKWRSAIGHPGAFPRLIGAAGFQAGNTRSGSCRIREPSHVEPFTEARSISVRGLSHIVGPRPDARPDETEPIRARDPSHIQLRIFAKKRPVEKPRVSLYVSSLSDVTHHEHHDERATVSMRPSFHI
jgi:hypothetical protein